MKKTTFITIVFMLTAVLAVDAQQDKKGDKKMMHQEMMQQKKESPQMMQMKGQNKPMMMRKKMMMQQMPMQEHMMMVKMLPNMQDELSLTQDQTKQLIDLKSSFEKQQVDHKAEMTQKRLKLDELMKNNGSTDEIRAQMRNCAETRIEMQIAAYETSLKMKELLSEEQRDQLSEIMDNEMQMMTPGMMNRGMMNPGMMNRGMMNQGMMNE